MPNTLTNLIPDLYAGLNMVSRELVGFLPSVGRDASFDRAAVGQSVRVPIAPTANGVDITPAMIVPEPTDQIVTNIPMTISKSRAYEFGFVGEERLGLDNNGPGANTLQANMIAESMRAIVNEMESDVAGVAYVAASRASGTAGTTPFATNLADSAQSRKILDDNGAPQIDRSLVINTSSGANLRTQTQLTKANEANSDDTLRMGSLLDLHGFMVRESGQSPAHTAGTGSGYLVNSGALAVGSTVIPVDTGTGTILAGDTVTFAGDANVYVVAATDIGGAGTITIGAPGLLTAVADDAAITVGAGYESNVAFSRNAIQMAMRAPALPTEGDAASDRTFIADPVTGLIFEASVYTGYRKVRYEIAAAWGQAAIKPEHISLLLG